jgi:hypothetical protein
MFRHSRVILRELVINAFNTRTVHLLLFCAMTNKCTIISQIITLLHVSTLSCHPQGASNQCFQYLYRASSIILCYDQQLHIYFTNYHTATCFDIIVPSSDSLWSITCQVTQVFQNQLLIVLPKVAFEILVSLGYVLITKSLRMTRWCRNM